MLLEEINLQKLPDNEIAVFFTPFLKVFGDRFVNNFINIKVVFVGLDLKTIKVRDFDYDIVSIVIPKDENRNHIINFIESLLSFRIYDSNYEIGDFRIINLRLDSYLQKKLKLIIEGKFSQLVNNNEDRIFTNPNRIKLLKAKDDEITELLQNDIEDKLGISPSLIQFEKEPKEPKMPPLAGREILGIPYDTYILAKEFIEKHILTAKINRL